MRALMALVPGANAGPYRIVEPLGRGGMASVYKAYEAKLDRYVALKVLPREFLHDPNFAQRFRQEAQVIARLEHPNIIPIYAYDIEEAEGIPWMAMRLIASGSLSDLLKRERLARARAVAILRGVAEALDYAHGKGIVHRDVKPQNVLLDEAARVYLADFGIAKILESSGGLTASGMITGTPQYMAPEQATGLKIGPPADVYALGIMAYEMLVGRVPFSADTPVAVLMKHVQEPLPLPAPDVVPEPMLRALLKAAAKKPEERWPTAGAFVDALAAGLGVPAAGRTRPRATRPTVEVPRTLPRPEAPPTVVSPATGRAPAGTAPPLEARPPIVRPPATRAETVPVAPRKPGTTAILVGSGRSGSSASPCSRGVALAGTFAAGLAARGAERPRRRARVPVTPATTMPAGPRDSSTVARGARQPAEQAPVTVRVAAARRPRPCPPPRRRGRRRLPRAQRPARDPARGTRRRHSAAASPRRRPVAGRRQWIRLLTLKSSGWRRRWPTATRTSAARPRRSSRRAGRSRRRPCPPRDGARRSQPRRAAAGSRGARAGSGAPAQGGVPALAQALHDTDALVASEAAKALGLIGEAAGGAAAALGAALAHPPSESAARRRARSGSSGAAPSPRSRRSSPRSPTRTRRCAPRRRARSGTSVRPPARPSRGSPPSARTATSWSRARRRARSTAIGRDAP